MIYRITGVESLVDRPDMFVVDLDFWNVADTGKAVGPPTHSDTLTIGGLPTQGEPIVNTLGMYVTASGALLSPWVLDGDVWRYVVPPDHPLDPLARMPPLDPAAAIDFHANRLAEQAQAEGRTGDHGDKRLRRSARREGHAANAAVRALVGQKRASQAGRSHP